MIFTYIVVGLLTFIFYIKWKQSYWKRKGVPTIDYDFFFGNIKKFVTKKSSMGETFLEIYQQVKKTNSRYGGFNFFWIPTFLPVDPAIIKHVMQNDFNHFMNHGVYHHSKDILSMNLLNLEGDKWKNLRAKLTPTFTSGKLKMMFETLLEKTDGLERVVEEFTERNEAFTVKDVLGRFTTDIIASCAFGIECNSLEEPNNIFRQYGKKVFEPNSARFWIEAIIPWDILGYLGYKNFGRDVSNFFSNIVKQTIKTREENEIFRKDFMHLLLQLKNDKSKNSITENDIIAQCFIFFLAGFETSSTAMTFALLELAQNLDIQEKIRDEINIVLNKYDGKLSYDAIMEMHYLEKVIQETLRKYPPVTVLPRVCNKTYKVPGTDVIIEKNTRLHIPVWGIHTDPEYYPNPEVFDPERFSEENKASRPDFTFLPFGDGPRQCIGLRFGMLQTKVGLISLLKKFKFTLNKKTPLPIKMDLGGVILSVKGEVWLNATKV